MLRPLLIVACLALITGCATPQPTIDFTGDVITDENRGDLAVEITRVSDLGPAGATIGGRVRDRERGEALAGVVAIVEGTQRGTASDADGYFVLDSLQADHTLTFSYVGYRDVSRSVRALMEERQ